MAAAKKEDQTIAEIQQLMIFLKMAAHPPAKNPGGAYVLTI